MATVLPAFFIWLFANTFLLPKLQLLWLEANLLGSKAQWIVDASYFLAHSIQVVFAAVILLLTALEYYFHAWPHYRRAVVSVVAIAFHTTVLLGLTAISVAVLVAAPILTRTK